LTGVATLAKPNPVGSSGCSAPLPVFGAPVVLVSAAAIAPYGLAASSGLAANVAERVAYVAIPGPAPGPAVLRLDLDAGTSIPFADAAAFAALDVNISALSGIALKDSQTLYVVDSSTNRVLQVTENLVNTFAGVADRDGGFADGPTTACLFRFSAPTQPAVGGNGVVYIADSGNHRVRKLDNGIVSTIAGSGIPGYKDATGSAAQFDTPDGITIECNGGLAITEASHRVRRIVFTSVQVSFFGFQTVAEVGTLAGSGVGESLDGTGGPTGTAQVFAPASIQEGKDNVLYWLDRGTGLLRSIPFDTAGAIAVTTPLAIPLTPPDTTFGLAGGFAEGLLVDSVNNQILGF
jgi:hypothetical protein